MYKGICRTPEPDNKPEDDAKAERYLKNLYKVSKSLEEIKQHLATRLNLLYRFYDDSVMPDKNAAPQQPIVNFEKVSVDAKEETREEALSKVNFGKAKNNAGKKIEKVFPPIAKQDPAPKKIIKTEEEPPKKFERPKAVYSNTSPYGIAAELRDKE